MAHFFEFIHLYVLYPSWKSTHYGDTKEPTVKMSHARMDGEG
jgi:hypothetical protein